MARRCMRGAIAACLATLLFACSREPPPAPAQRWVPVRVQAVGLSKASVSSVRYTAVLGPNSQVNLAFQVSGYVRSLLQRRGPDGSERPVTQGDAVRAGEVLATINDDAYADKVKAAQGTLAAAQAALNKTSADFKRAKALLASRSMTESNYDAAQQAYDTAKANVASAQAQLDDARFNLAHCALRAPLNAVVIRRNVAVGDLVGPTTQAFTLADMTAVKARFAVPDFMLKNLSIGDTLHISTRSEPQRIYSGAITSIAASADPKTRVFNVELTVPNPSGILRDGMVASLRVPTRLQASKPELTVPIRAVVQSKTNPNGYAVYTVQKRGDQLQARLQAVDLGPVLGNRIVVLSGVRPGEQIVVTGVNTVWDGATVRLVH